MPATAAPSRRSTSHVDILRRAPNVCSHSRTLSTRRSHRVPLCRISSPGHRLQYAPCDPESGTISYNSGKIANDLHPSIPSTQTDCYGRAYYLYHMSVWQLVGSARKCSLWKIWTFQREQTGKYSCNKVSKSGCNLKAS